MKRVIAITGISLLVVATSAASQSSTSSSGQNRPLADVAKDEEARRKSVRKPAKTYTNGSLKQDISAGVGAPPPAGVSSDSSTAPSNPGSETPATGDSAAQDKDKDKDKDQKYWQNRIKTARDQVTRLQMFADSLQTRINSLTTDIVNRDDPAQRAKLEQDRNASVAELERVKKDLDTQTKVISTIEDEARRAGVPAGWLRPGA